MTPDRPSRARRPSTLLLAMLLAMSAGIGVPGCLFAAGAAAGGAAGYAIADDDDDELDHDPDDDEWVEED